VLKQSSSPNWRDSMQVEVFQPLFFTLPQP
jgi:hypothetical protein